MLHNTFAGNKLRLDNARYNNAMKATQSHLKGHMINRILHS